MTSISFHSFGTPYGTDFLRELGFKVDKRWEFLMDLCDSEEDLWKKVHSKKRNLIKKGQKSGISVKRCSDIDEVLALRQLALATQKRKESEDIPFPVAAESYYRSIKDKLIDKGLGRLYLAYEGERAIAGAFFVGFHNSAYYVLSSADKEGLDKAAPDLILWTCMTDFQKEGFQIFNLGGVSEKDLHGTPFEESGLYHFKKRFSANEVPCYRSELILRPLDKKLLNGLRKTKALVFNS
jgi:lipid II:glycine glycyltransferase (peptidoglycan interpeptide bridge formation enzyme)